MPTYDYERDSLPIHVERVRRLRQEIATMRDEIRYSAEAVPYWYVQRLENRRAELREVLSYRGVRAAVGN